MTHRDIGAIHDDIEANQTASRALYAELKAANEAYWHIERGTLVVADVGFGGRRRENELVKVSVISFRQHGAKPSISGYRQRKDGSWFKRDQYIGTHWELVP